MFQQLFNFLLLLAVVIVFFAILKRPLYEAMGIAFLLLLLYNGKLANIFVYLKSAASSSILFTIILFLVFSSILKETGVVKDCIDIIIALVGRIPGGAGLVALLSSAFVGAMSGSGPGNVAATGSITIPLMKEAGYPSEFAAGVCMSGSCLSPIIPPSATIISAFACLSAVSGYENMQVSELWGVMYAISAVFIVQRIVQFYIMYAALGVKRQPVSSIPKLKDAWKKGWKGFMLVPIIILPFALDTFFADFFVSSIGATAAKNFSSAILVITPPLSALYCILISNRSKKFTLSSLCGAIEKDIKPICSMAATLLFSYAISALLADCDIVSATSAFLESLDMSFVGMVLLLMLIMTVLGMFMAGTSLIPILGPVYVSILAAYGVSPVLTVAVIPALFVSLGQMTPPFAVCLFAANGIAQSDFTKTSNQAILWSIGQFLVLFLIIVGIIPVVGI